ncbi:MAG TPA: SPOR domain-containing protein [Kofleriaceae bacterium]|nr:SPOR domain-containing protein [Kofleriaceae bacterium]
MSRSDTELFKDKVEVSLDGRQIFYLFFGGAVIACLVFVLGVMVGKRVEARSHVHSETSTSAARDPLAALDQLSADADRLTFPAALTGEREKPLGVVDEVLAAARVEPAAPVPKPVPAKAEIAKIPEPPAAKAKPKPEPKPEPEPEPDPAPAPAKASATSGSYTLQLSSFQDRDEADSFHGKLVGAGLNPYIVEANVPDKGTWYRVRLGSYDDYDAAIRGKKEFERRHKIIAYVTRVKR